MFSVTVRTRFKASHSVQIGAEPRETAHGHDWLVEVEAAADALDHHGLVIDFHRVEHLLDECLEDFRGARLDELPAFAAVNATAENVAHTIHRRLDERLRGSGVRLMRTTAWETDSCGGTYRPL